MRGEERRGEREGGGVLDSKKRETEVVRSVPLAQLSAFAEGGREESTKKVHCQ